MEKELKIVFVLSFIVLSIVYCGGESSQMPEISTQPEMVSCQFVGLAERNGEPIVDLIFKNKTGKHLKAVYGGLSIVNAEGEIIQRTGFTYGRPFADGEEKNIPAFAYISIQPEALEVLENAVDFVPIIFELSEVILENGESIQF